MTKHKRQNDNRGVPTRTSHQTLAAEAADWDNRRLTPAAFDDDPAAVPRSNEATAISLRMPSALLEIVKRFAEREGIGYQVLIKRWLDDRVRRERARLRGAIVKSRGRRPAPSFPLFDRGDGDCHYRQG